MLAVVDKSARISMNMVTKALLQYGGLVSCLNGVLYCLHAFDT